MKILTKKSIKALIQPRAATSHKGTHGHALIIAGNEGRMGAAVIAARACLRTGAGLLTVNVPKAERFIVQTTIPEAMVVMRENETDNFNTYSAISIGPGIGTDTIAEALLVRLLSECNKPLLLDADALNIMANNKNLWDKIPENTILTPHPKEFDRLFGVHETVAARIETAIKKAQHYNIVIVLKGNKTLITSEGKAFFNSTGNAGLAKGGSGDALTGIITAFLAQGYTPFNAAKQGVYLHGLAADMALKNQSMESLLITDVIECLGKAFKQIIGY